MISKIIIVISIMSVSSIIMCGEGGEGALPTWKTVNALVAEDGEVEDFHRPRTQIQYRFSCR